jgi:hypothetical protein
MALSRIYVIWGNVSFVAGLFFGLKSAVLALAAHMPCCVCRTVGCREVPVGFNPGEMLIGLGMAETTPGPLPDGLSPLMTATLAGLLVTWVTFTPCFLWVFLGVPLRGGSMWRPRAWRRTVCSDCGCGRIHRQSCRMVRHPRDLSRYFRVARLWLQFEHTCFVEPCDRGGGCNFPVQSRHHAHFACLLARGRGAAARFRGCVMTLGTLSGSFSRLIQQSATSELQGDMSCESHLPSCSPPLCQRQ